MVCWWRRCWTPGTGGAEVAAVLVCAQGVPGNGQTLVEVVVQLRLLQLELVVLVL